MLFFHIKELFTSKKKFYIRLDKAFPGSEPSAYYPHIDFVKNELLGVYQPQIELFDSISRATEKLWLEDKINDEEKVDIAEINGEELKAFIEKLNKTFKKSINIKYNLRQENSLWTNSFSTELPGIYKVIREEYFCCSGGINFIQILIMIIMGIATLWMNSKVPFQNIYCFEKLTLKIN